MPKGIKGFQKGNKINVGKIAWNRGITWREMFSEELCEKMYKERASRNGKNNPMWRGEKATKSAIHDWMERYFGKPNKCEICETKTAKKYHWANKDHKYKRTRKDWMRLCAKCHVKYDKNYARRKRNGKGQFC